MRRSSRYFQASHMLIKMSGIVIWLPVHRKCLIFTVIRTGRGAKHQTICPICETCFPSVPTYMFSAFPVLFWNLIFLLPCVSLDPPVVAFCCHCFLENHFGDGLYFSAVRRTSFFGTPCQLCCRLQVPETLTRSVSHEHIPSQVPRDLQPIMLVD